MTQRFTVFVSSTIKDFACIRIDLKAWLTQYNIEVRMSESNDFPVGDQEIHSHDICLRAIQGSHIVLLLIGERFGGVYKGGSQSITWREYEEALRHRIPVIPVVLKSVNQVAEQYARTQKAPEKALTQQANSQTVNIQAESLLNIEGIDKRVFDFIASVRKQQINNWMHLDWDGSFTYLKNCLQERLNSAFVHYQTYYKTQTEYFPMYVQARSAIDSFVCAALPEVHRKQKKGRQEFANGLLELFEKEREILFGFKRTDRFNFVIYTRSEADSNVLEVFARRADSRIQQNNRSWQVGQGHVGQCVAQNKIFVSPDLPRDPSAQNTYPTDQEQYVSIISVPIKPQRQSSGEPKGALIITSNRRDQFYSPAQPDVLTAESIASIISTMALLEYSHGKK